MCNVNLEENDNENNKNVDHLDHLWIRLRVYYYQIILRSNFQVLCIYKVSTSLY